MLLRCEYIGGVNSPSFQCTVFPPAEVQSDTVSLVYEINLADPTESATLYFDDGRKVSVVMAMFASVCG